jgi:hypothetical protein
MNGQPRIQQLSNAHARAQQHQNDRAVPDVQQ